MSQIACSKRHFPFISLLKTPFMPKVSNKRPTFYGLPKLAFHHEVPWGKTIWRRYRLTFHLFWARVFSSHLLPPLASRPFNFSANRLLSPLLGSLAKRILMRTCGHPSAWRELDQHEANPIFFGLCQFNRCQLVVRGLPPRAHFLAHFVHR